MEKADPSHGDRVVLRRVSHERRGLKEKSQRESLSGSIGYISQTFRGRQRDEVGRLEGWKVGEKTVPRQTGVCPTPGVAGINCPDGVRLVGWHALGRTGQSVPDLLHDVSVSLIIIVLLFTFTDFLTCKIHRHK